MDTAEFASLRGAFHDFTERTKMTSVDVKPAGRAATQDALDALGLSGLRRGNPPAATGQECALLAEEHGVQPVASSFLGTVLLAPELLRLVGTPAAEPGRTPTIALARNLRFPDTEPALPHDLVGWDCEGADGALGLTPDGTVTRFALADEVPNADVGRELREVVGPAAPLGHLDRDDVRRWQAFALVMVVSELVGAARSFVGQAAEFAAAHHTGEELVARATDYVQRCSTAARHAAAALDDESPAAALHAAQAAKAEANTSTMEAIFAGMQVFGERAQAWDHVAHLYLRKAQVGAVTMATTTDLLLSLAGLGEA